MHTAAMEYVAQWATDEPIRVLDLGGRDVNGSPRSLFPNAHYWSIDLIDGPGVDEIADASIWRGEQGPYDLVLCCEVFEHTRDWPQILWTAKLHCERRGRLVVTCAGLWRAAHSGIDGSPMLKPHEYYHNIDEGRLFDCLLAGGWYVEDCAQRGEDVQATAVPQL